MPNSSLEAVREASALLSPKLSREGLDQEALVIAHQLEDHPLSRKEKLFRLRRLNRLLDVLLSRSTSVVELSSADSSAVDEARIEQGSDEKRFEHGTEAT